MSVVVRLLFDCCLGGVFVFVVGVGLDGPISTSESAYPMTVNEY